MSYGYDGPQGSGNRLPLRYIAALIVAAIGVISYMFRTEVNPVTGEKQHIAMSVDQEMALGLEAAPQMATEMGGAVPDGRSPGPARRRGRAPAGRAEQREPQPVRRQLPLHPAGRPRTINAFALPGGQIFITVALFEKLDTEAQLAGVLGHEIGHVIHRHSAQHMATGQLGQMLTVAVGIGASDEQGRGRSAQMAAAMVNQMMQLKYSRNDESQSDQYGLEALAQAGYDPTGMLDVMRVLKEASQGPPPARVPRLPPPARDPPRGHRRPDPGRLPRRDPRGPHPGPLLAG
jgi:predicted Zn-dependent protease